MKNAFKIIVALLVVGSFAFIAPKDSKSKQITVVIDGRHGGKDDGMKINEVSEKEIILNITKKIKFQNKDKDIVIHLKRNDDEFVSLIDRTNFINKIKPDLVLSYTLMELKMKLLQESNFSSTTKTQIMKNRKQLQKN